MALLIGTLIGPSVTQAASSALVRVEGAGSSHQAKVSASGELSVNANLSRTRAGQVTVTQADAANMVVAFGSQTCSNGGFYTIPAGKALIITSVDLYSFLHFGDSGVHDLSLYAGPVASPCTHFLAASVPTDAGVSQNQRFAPGIPVPAGQALGLLGSNDDGQISVYGYLVPASAVPLSALRTASATSLGGPR